MRTMMDTTVAITTTPVSSAILFIRGFEQVGCFVEVCDRSSGSDGDDSTGSHPHSDSHSHPHTHSHGHPHSHAHSPSAHTGHDHTHSSSCSHSHSHARTLSIADSYTPGQRGSYLGATRQMLPTAPSSASISSMDMGR